MTAHAGRTGTGDEVRTGLPARHEQLGPYRLVHQLGEGGMGVVHLALDRQGRAVAIKVLRSHIAYDPEARSRLEREVDTLSRIRDERVAAVIDADIFGERPYLVTRYVAGPSLDEVVAAQGPLRGDDLLRLGRGLVGALDAIHAVGVVHRDLKPGNVLLEDGDPVVIDFGIAHVADDVRLTSVGLVMGTPGYLSPEVVQGATVTEATDWWGWAATLAFGASGRPPFGRGPMDAVLDRVRRGDTDLTGIDLRLQPLLQAALSPDPGRRPPAAEVVGALERYAAGGPATVALPDRVAGVGGAGGPDVPDWARAARGPVAPAPVAVPAGLDQQEWWEPEPLGWDVPLPEEPRRRHTRRAEPAPLRGTSALPQGDEYAAEWPAPVAPPPAPEDWGIGDGEPARPEGETGERDPRIGRPLRSGTLAALTAALAAAAANWPVIVVVIAVIWCWVARFSDRAVTSLVVHRYDRGRRRSDPLRAVAASPWHVLGAALGTIAGLVLPAVVAVSATICATLGLSAVASASSAVVVAPALAIGLLAGTLVAWWGPGGSSLRRGSRSIVRGIVRPGLASEVVVGVLVAGALALAIAALVRGGDVTWWPLSGDPFAALRAPLG